MCSPSSAAASSTGSTTCSEARCRRWTASDRTSCASASWRPGSREGEIHEVVIATDPDVEGEATAYYVAERLASSGGDRVPPGARPAGGVRSRVRGRAHHGPGVRGTPRDLRSRRLGELRRPPAGGRTSRRRVLPRRKHTAAEAAVMAGRIRCDAPRVDPTAWIPLTFSVTWPRRRAHLRVGLPPADGEMSRNECRHRTTDHRLTRCRHRATPERAAIRTSGLPSTSIPGDRDAGSPARSRSQPERRSRPPVQLDLSPRDR